MAQAAVARAPAAIRWISSAPHAALPSAEEHFSCAQGKPIFRREQQGGDAQGRTANGGPGGEPGGNEGTDERGGGGWDSGNWAAAEAMELSWSVGRGASPGAESGAVVETTAPSLDQVGEAGTASPARLVSLASATARKRRCMVSCCGVMMWYGSQGLLLACRLPVARVSAAGAQHAAPASLHDLHSRVEEGPSSGARWTLRAPKLKEGVRSERNNRRSEKRHTESFRLVP